MAHPVGVDLTPSASEVLGCCEALEVGLDLYEASHAGTPAVLSTQQVSEFRSTLGRVDR